MAEHAHSTPTLTPHVNEATPPPSRRTLFAAAGAVIMGSGITAGAAASVADLVPANPDVQLIAIGDQARPCVAQYEQLQTKWWSMQCGDPGLTACAAEMDIPHVRLCDLAEQARDIQASTPQGWQAKAVLIRHLMNVEFSLGGKMQFDTFDQEVIWSLVCDMTGRA